MKFSTLTNDSVRYFQTSIEGFPSLRMVQHRLKSRVLSSQFDNFLEVKVDGPKVDVLMHTVAEVSSEFFAPQHYNAVDFPVNPPKPSNGEKLWAVYRQSQADRRPDRRCATAHREWLVGARAEFTSHTVSPLPS